MHAWNQLTLLAQNTERVQPGTNYFAYGLIGAAVGTAVIVAAIILQIRKNKQDEKKVDGVIGRRRR